MIQLSPIITASHTIVKPRIFGVALVPVFPDGASRSIPAQVGIPVVLPDVAPSVGKEHPHEGSIATDDGKPSRAVQDDPTLEK
jgi:hypothetical protein